MSWPSFAEGSARLVVRGQSCANTAKRHGDGKWRATLDEDEHKVYTVALKKATCPLEAPLNDLRCRVEASYTTPWNTILKPTHTDTSADFVSMGNTRRRWRRRPERLKVSKPRSPVPDPLREHPFLALDRREAGVHGEAIGLACAIEVEEHQGVAPVAAVAQR